jgi:aerobic carbon-monoxide dehydrogenase medium subunit
MKPPPFELHMPGTLPEAVALLERLEGAKVLAGGQSLMAMLNLRFVFPDHLVDINRIPELSYIRIEDRMVRIGAMTRQRRIERSEDLSRSMPILREALLQVGHRQTRNRGTIGGSLSHLDPAAELPAMALLHDAEIRVVGAGGERVLRMEDFMADYMTPAIAENELVAEVALPRWAAGHGHAFLEVARRHGDFAVASAGVLLEGDAGAITRAAIVVGGVDILPRRLPAAEAMLAGRAGHADLFAEASRQAAALDSPGDVHFTPDHRRHLAAALVRRALGIAHDRLTGIAGGKP